MSQRIAFWIVPLIVAGAASAVLAQATQSTQPITVPMYGVYEVVLKSDVPLKNPFWDAEAQATFASPSGKETHVGGFYYGPGEWRVRFVPREEGAWKYVATLKSPPRSAPYANVSQAGAFACRGKSRDGFLRLSKVNPYRMEYETGKPFYGVGIQTCGVVEKVDFDGPDADGKWRAVPVAEWAKAFEGAVNLVRIQLGNGNESGCAVPLLPAEKRGPKGKLVPNPRYAEVCPDGVGDRYDCELAAKLDEAYRLHRAAGFSEMLILFQDMSAFGRQETAFGPTTSLEKYKSPTAESMPLQEKYIRYVVARYAAFVDIWEIFNEDSYATPEYLAHLHKVIRAADPYGHIITSNFSLYDQPFCEIITPHEYVTVPANEIDIHLAKEIAAYKSYGKPVQYSEFGNKGSLSNVDPVKWRLAAWTAFMNECGMLYWSMSGTKTEPKAGALSGNSNTYIGPDTREHLRAFHQLTGDLPIDLRPRYVYPGFMDLRFYALGNGKQAIVYVHHYKDHQTECKPQQITVDTGAGAFRVSWYDPETGKPLGEPKTQTTRQRFLSLRTPAFKIDAVCRLDRVEDAASQRGE